MIELNNIFKIKYITIYASYGVLRIVTNIFGNIVDICKYEKKWAKENDKFLIFDNDAIPFTFYKGKSCNY